MNATCPHLFSYAQAQTLLRAIPDDQERRRELNQFARFAYLFDIAGYVNERRLTRSPFVSVNGFDGGSGRDVAQDISRLRSNVVDISAFTRADEGINARMPYSFMASAWRIESERLGLDPEAWEREEWPLPEEETEYPEEENELPEQEHEYPELENGYPEQEEYPGLEDENLEHGNEYLEPENEYLEQEENLGQENEYPEQEEQQQDPGQQPNEDQPPAYEDQAYPPAMDDYPAGLTDLTDLTDLSEYSPDFEGLSDDENLAYGEDFDNEGYDVEGHDRDANYPYCEENGCDEILLDYNECDCEEHPSDCEEYPSDYEDYPPDEDDDAPAPSPPPTQEAIPPTDEQPSWQASQRLGANQRLETTSIFEAFTSKQAFQEARRMFLSGVRTREIETAFALGAALQVEPGQALAVDDLAHGINAMNAASAVGHTNAEDTINNMGTPDAINPGATGTGDEANGNTASEINNTGTASSQENQEPDTNINIQEEDLYEIVDYGISILQTGIEPMSMHLPGRAGRLAPRKFTPK